MTAQTKIVELYTLSTCPWCKKAKAYLDEKRVQYSYIDFDLADEVVQARIQEEMMARKAAAFPYAKIGDDFIVGYNPEAYARLLLRLPGANPVGGDGRRGGRGGRI
jgi:glutaredoxin